MSAPSPIKSPIAEVPFGGNEVRLTVRQWLLAVAIVALALAPAPRLWMKIERFGTGSDYRIPYQLSNDYWLYARRIGQVADRKHVIVLGDSVVWGEYVLPDGTLSHFLNQNAGKADQFINAGVNGLFPLAQEGLIGDYGQALHHQKVIVHYNVLWMTSPKADLSATKEEPFNHSRLVPQFIPRIPCYKADAGERLSAIAGRHIGFISWVDHLQNAYFSQKSIPKWTLADEGGNAWKNPLAQITFSVPSAPGIDPRRGPNSPRHKPWSDPAQFEWVDPDASLQWHAFQRVLTTLRRRDNDVLVLLGPFNEHMLSGENRAAYRTLRDSIAGWLTANRIPHIVPDALPSPLYADASHPLTEGYALLAKRIYEAELFQRWLIGRNRRL